MNGTRSSFMLYGPDHIIKQSSNPSSASASKQRSSRSSWHNSMAQATCKGMPLGPNSSAYAEAPNELSSTMSSASKSPDTSQRSSSSSWTQKFTQKSETGCHLHTSAVSALRNTPFIAEYSAAITNSIRTYLVANSPWSGKQSACYR